MSVTTATLPATVTLTRESNTWVRAIIDGRARHGDSPLYDALAAEMDMPERVS